jgi:hypothetical protein
LDEFIGIPFNLIFLKVACESRIHQPAGRLRKPETVSIDHRCFAGGRSAPSSHSRSVQGLAYLKNGDRTSATKAMTVILSSSDIASP